MAKEYGKHLRYVEPLRFVPEKEDTKQDVSASIALEISATGKSVLVLHARIGGQHAQKVITLRSFMERGKPLEDCFKEWFPPAGVDLFKALLRAIEPKGA